MYKLTMILMFSLFLANCRSRTSDTQSRMLDAETVHRRSQDPVFSAFYVDAVVTGPYAPESRLCLYCVFVKDAIAFLFVKEFDDTAERVIKKLDNAVAQWEGAYEENLKFVVVLLTNDSVDERKEDVQFVYDKLALRRANMAISNDLLGPRGNSVPQGTNLSFTLVQDSVTEYSWTSRTGEHVTDDRIDASVIFNLRSKYPKARSL